MQLRLLPHEIILSTVLIAGLASSSNAADEDIRGFIEARGVDGTLQVRTDAASTLTVILNELTKVRRVGGPRPLEANSSLLIPGLRVRLWGTREGSGGFVAQQITFSQSDMRLARAMRGTVDPADPRSLDNQRRIQENVRTLERQRQILASQVEQIVVNSARIASNLDWIRAAGRADAATDDRAENLDDYDVISTLIIHFRNGHARIEPKYKAQLRQLTDQAKEITDYLIQVRGYAPILGSEARMQKLSAERADAVIAELRQGGIPPTNIVVPAVMGVSELAATNKTSTGRADHRRTIVTLLQSRGTSTQ